MRNLFKAILLCAILSNTFTPCFSIESGLETSVASAFSQLPMALPEALLEENTKSNNIQLKDRNSNLPTAQSDSALDEEAFRKEYCEGNDKISSCSIVPYVSPDGVVENFKTVYKCLADRELEAINIEKGRTFEVKSLQPMSYESSTGTEVVFESIYPEKIFISKDPMKLIFKGEVIKNTPPRKGGSSGTLKVVINGVKLESIVYPAEAYISKMNKRGLMFGAIVGPSIYKDNLSDTANNGVINNYYNMDPCSKATDECVGAVAKPFYFLSGALLHTVDLFLAPVVAFFAPGKEVYIPEGTEFEIKLEKDIPVLEI